ncbi:hypothetical protein PR048_028876 [Dryococelus australis]|uniref:Zinc finger PHD-type domain-containing protein n=1 Tax=Dryococelus australis TaxID=614101 RepID=A0ABQ9GCE3_9NEOP|nr:hypothetical protein PR048_028876 [Dryococelus australis]
MIEVTKTFLKLSEDDDCPCLFCGELYKASMDGEGWIRCFVCHKWTHDACAGIEEENDDNFHRIGRKAVQRWDFCALRARTPPPFLPLRFAANHCCFQILGNCVPSRLSVTHTVPWNKGEKCRFSTASSEEEEDFVIPSVASESWCSVREKLSPVLLKFAVYDDINVDTKTTQYGDTVAERLACLPPIKVIRAQSPAGPLQIFACGNRAGRCRWSAGPLGDLPPPPPPPPIPAVPHTHLSHPHLSQDLDIISSVHTERQDQLRHRAVQVLVQQPMAHLTGATTFLWMFFLERMKNFSLPPKEYFAQEYKGKGTIPSYEYPGATPPGIEPGSPFWEAVV